MQNLFWGQRALGIPLEGKGTQNLRFIQLGKKTKIRKFTSFEHHLGASWKRNEQWA